MSHALLVAGDAERAQRLNDLAAGGGETLGGETLSIDRLATLDEVPARLGAGAVDVVLLDADGPAPFEGLARLAERDGFDTPVIVLFGDGQADAERRAIEAGAADALAWADLTPPLLLRSVRYCMDRARSRREVAQLALFDGETGLARAPLFWEVLSLAVRRARRNQDFLAVLAINLDNLADAPDPRAAIREAAHRLTALLRASDTVARFDGDMLLVLVEGMPRVEDVQTVAERIIERIGEPMAMDGQEVRLSASLGISLYPTVALSPETLVGDATKAMHAAVEEGGATFKFA